MAFSVVPTSLPATLGCLSSYNLSSSSSETEPTREEAHCRQQTSNWEPRFSVCPLRTLCPGGYFSIQDVLTWGPPAWGSYLAHPDPRQLAALHALVLPQSPKSFPICPVWVKQKQTYKQQQQQQKGRGGEVRNECMMRNTVWGKKNYFEHNPTTTNKDHEEPSKSGFHTDPSPAHYNVLS